MRDLQEANLIVRYRPEGGKEVLVDLGRVGKEEVDRAMLPPWLERLASAIAEIANGAPLDAEALAQDLQEAGAPSRLAADRLTEAVARLAPAAAFRGGSPRPESTNVLHFIHKVEKLQEDGISRLQEMRTFEAMPARALFGAKAAS